MDIPHAGTYYREIFITAYARIIPWAAITTFAAFCLLLLNHAFYYPLVHDDAFLAGVAKNLAFGYGWGSTTDSLLPIRGAFNHFDYTITTGPSLLGFIALGIHFFGNEQWVVRVAPLTLNLALLLLFFFRLRRNIDSEAFWACLLLLPLFFYRLGFSPWIDPIGPVPAALFMLNGALFLYEGQSQKRFGLALLAGVFLSLSVLSKTVALCGVMGIFVLLAGGTCLSSDAREKRAYGLCATTLLAGFLVPLAAWLMYQHHIIQSLPETTRTLRGLLSREFFLYAGGSGLGALFKAIDTGTLPSFLAAQVQHNFHRNTAMMAGLSGPNILIFSIYTGLLLTAAAAVALRPWHNRLLLTLTAPALSYLAWAYLFADYTVFGFPVYTGILLSAPLLFILLAKFRPLVIAAFSYLIFSSAYSTPTSLSGLPEKEALTIHTATHPKKQASLDVVDFMATNPQYGPFAGGCGWLMAYEIDYLWPGPGVLKNCHEVLGEGLQFNGLKNDPENQNRHALLWRMFRSNFDFFSSEQLVASVSWTKPVAFTFVENDLVRDAPDSMKGFSDLIRACSQVVYANAFYKLYRCSHADLQKYIEGNDGLPLFLPQWAEEILLDEAASGRKSIKSLIYPW